MSGGSYNNLWLHDIYNGCYSGLCSFHKMEERIKSLRFGSNRASECGQKVALTQMARIRELEQQVSEIAKDLKSVWQVVERYDSGDDGLYDVFEVFMNHK